MYVKVLARQRSDIFLDTVYSPKQISN